MNWSWGKYRARRCFLGRFTFDDPQFTAPARPLLIVLRVSLIRGTSSIIKRRYLFSRPAETYGRSFIDAVLFPQAVITDVLRRKKCYGPASRILHGLPARYRSRHSRRAVRQVLEFGFRCWTGLPSERSSSASRDDFPRCSPCRARRRPCCVVSLEKTFHRATEQSGETAGAIKREKKGKR